MNDSYVFTGIFVTIIIGFFVLLGVANDNTTKCITTAIEKGYSAVEVQAICK